jgi:hypothetical protein
VGALVNLYSLWLAVELWIPNRLRRVADGTWVCAGWMRTFFV